MPGGALISLLTLGCKLNLADSGALGGMLSAAGHQVTEHLCEADAVIINTCTVTATADQKSRKLIRAARRLSPGAVIAVTGCYPRSGGAEIAKRLGADFVAGTGQANRESVIDFLAARLPTGPHVYPAGESTVALSVRTRHFVEAQTGCDDVCAFCIIPRARGRERSRPAEAVCRDIAAATIAGTREVVVTGTQLGAWGRDLPEGGGPAGLIAAILEKTDVPRLRFSSLQPQDIKPELLALWENPRLMPHFHLALQSGSDRILEAMRRRYTALEFARAVERIYATVPNVAITTDVIAGFPGETAADFGSTLRLCRDAGFARIHAFPFSARPGTVAARLPEPVPRAAKRERMQQLLATGTELAGRYQETLVGTVRPVLWEEPGVMGRGTRPVLEGYTDNYVRVRTHTAGLANRITPARLVKRQDGVVLGDPLATGSGRSDG